MWLLPLCSILAVLQPLGFAVEAASALPSIGMRGPGEAAADPARRRLFGGSPQEHRLATATATHPRGPGPPKPLVNRPAKAARLGGARPASGGAGAVHEIMIGRVSAPLMKSRPAKAPGPAEPLTSSTSALPCGASALPT